MADGRTAWERDISRELGEIRAEMRTLLAPLPDRMNKHDERLCVLERWQFKSTAIVSVFAFLFGKLTHSIDPLLSGLQALFSK